MKFLLIGGTGIIGIGIARQLLEREQEVYCMDYAPNFEALRSLNNYSFPIKAYKGDIICLQSLIELIKNVKPDVIINLAYLMSTPTDESFYGSAKTNVLGITNIFEAARLMDVSRVIYASSVAVYGDSQAYYGDREITEDDGCPPWQITRLYAATKTLNEQFARRYTEKYGMELVAVRPCIILAPGRESGRTATIARMIHWPAKNKAVHVPFRIDMPVCVQYVEDTAHVFVRIALAKSVMYPCYNSGGHNTTLREIYEIVKKYIPTAEISFDESASDHKLINKIDNKRISEEFGIRFFKLEENIKKIIDSVKFDFK